jgi:hypothetical protein
MNSAAEVMFDNALYTIFKVTPSVGRKPIMFRVPRKQVEFLLAKILKPRLVRVVIEGEFGESEFTHFEAHSDHEAPIVIAGPKEVPVDSFIPPKDIEWVG